VKIGKYAFYVFLSSEINLMTVT